MPGTDLAAPSAPGHAATDHPPNAGAQAGSAAIPTMSDAADYRLFVRQRITIAGTRYQAGQVLLVPSNRLRVAAHLCRCGTARPADRATALDVELFQRLNERLQ